MHRWAITGTMPVLVDRIGPDGKTSLWLGHCISNLCRMLDAACLETKSISNSE